MQLAAAGLLLAACLALLSAVLWQNAANRDFICYWSSARLLRAHGNPYATQAILKIENAAGGAYREPFIMRNPPWALFLIAPLGFFPAPVAALLWLMALIVALLASIRLLRMTPRPPPLVVYLFAPVLGCAMAGQTSIFLLLGIALFFKFHRRWPLLAGSALTLAAMKPHLFLLFWPVLLVHCCRKRQWRILAGLGAGLAVATAGALILDPHVWTNYLAAIRAEHIEGQYLPNIPCTLRTLLPWHPLWLQAIPSVLGLVWAARFYARRRDTWSWRRDGAELLLISVTVSPYSWPFDQLLFLPAIIFVCCVQTSRRTIPLLTVLNGVAILLLVMMFPLSSPAYAWSGAACLLWYLWARRQAPIPVASEPAVTPVLAQAYAA
jgi:hypothetical protein